MKKNSIFLPLLTVTILSVIGLIFIFSAFYYKSTSFFANTFVIKELFFILLGILLFVFIANIDYRIFKNLSFILYISGIIILVLSMVIFRTYRGRWIKLGIISFQTSEFMKFGFLLYFAHFISRHFERSVTLNILEYSMVFFKTLMITFIPMILVLKQPDLGTSFVFAAIWIIFLFFFRATGFIVSLYVILFGIVIGVVFFISSEITEIRGLFGFLLNMNFIKYITLFFAILLFSMLLNIVIAFLFGQRINILFTILLIMLFFVGLFLAKGVISHLKQYQKNRIITFVNPSYDIRGSGWNVIQSKIAIGSGRVKGKGLFKGTQNKFNFLPERHTDFIFSLISEEWGFYGAFLVIFLEFLLLFYLLFVAFKANDAFGLFFALGSFTLFFMHIVANIGMNLGVMPVTGIPLPFISYGGSFYLISIFILGINVNIFKQSHEVRRLDLFIK
ncbi:rod shape-determining protein RodA [bacterium]|nr:rod shape-determining protein RodA [bacterium]